MKGKLKKLMIDRIDLVPQGANPDAHIKLFKSKGDDLMTFTELLKSLPIEQQAVILQEIDAKDTEIADLTKERDEAVIAKEAVEVVKGDLAKKVDEMEKAAKGEPTVQDLLKEADPRIVELVQKAQASEEEAVKVAKAAEEERIEKEFNAKVESFKSLPMTAEEFGKAFRAFSEADSEGFVKLEALLKSIDAVVEKSELFKELGTDSDAGKQNFATVEDKIDSLAKELMKADETLTYAKAYREAAHQNEGLYNEYLGTNQNKKEG